MSSRYEFAAKPYKFAYIFAVAFSRGFAYRLNEAAFVLGRSASLITPLWGVGAFRKGTSGKSTQPSTSFRANEMTRTGHGSEAVLDTSRFRAYIPPS